MCLNETALQWAELKKLSLAYRRGVHVCVGLRLYAQTEVHRISPVESSAPPINVKIYYVIGFLFFPVGNDRNYSLKSPPGHLAGMSL